MKKIFSRLLRGAVSTTVFLLILGLMFSSIGWPKIKYAQAASPTVASRSSGTDNNPTITVTLSGTPASGNLYLVFLQGANTSITWSQNAGTTGWTELADSSGLAIYYKQIGASEPNPVFALSSSNRSAYVVMQITGHENPSTQAPQVSTAATGTGTTPNPGSLTPTGGSKDYLWIAAAGATDARRAFNSGPTNYSNLTTINTGGGPNGSIAATAERALTASSEDPGTFSLNGSSTWVARTVAVHPNSAAPISISLTTDGSVAFGIVALDASQDNTATGVNDVEVVQVDSGGPVNLDAQSTVWTQGGNTWTLGASNGSDQVQWEFASSTTNWVTFTTAGTDFEFDLSVADSATRNINLRLTLPTDTTSNLEYSATVTITASAP